MASAHFSIAASFILHALRSSVFFSGRERSSYGLSRTRPYYRQPCVTDASRKTRLHILFGDHNIKLDLAQVTSEKLGLCKVHADHDDAGKDCSAHRLRR